MIAKDPNTSVGINWQERYLFKMPHPWRFRFSVTRVGPWKLNFKYSICSVLDTGYAWSYEEH